MNAAFSPRRYTIDAYPTCREMTSSHFSKKRNRWTLFKVTLPIVAFGVMIPKIGRVVAFDREDTNQKSAFMYWQITTPRLASTKQYQDIPLPRTGNSYPTKGPTPPTAGIYPHHRANAANRRKLLPSKGQYRQRRGTTPKTGERQSA